MSSSSSSLILVETDRFSILADPSDGTSEKTNETTNKQKSNKKKNTTNTTSTKKEVVSKSNQSKSKSAAREWTSELQMDFDRILSVGEECISSKELKDLLLAKGRGSGNNNDNGFRLYDGFEPSGRMHIAQGVFKAMNVNKCTHKGTNSTFVFWVADWFALMNDKMGGDLTKIRIVGDYLIEVWKAAGMDLTNVQFKWASDEITQRANTYWPTMLDVARRFNVTRIKKCCQIMGRLEGSLTSAQVLYPLMQCTDVFFLNADICQLGVDQRKVNMLAREYCDAAGIKRKPVILSHHMLYGLKAGQEKMSKSDPDSAVFMEDSAHDVQRKIMAAYCPSKEEDNAAEDTTTTTTTTAQDAGKESMHLTKDKLKNPCLDYIEHIILSPPGATFTAAGKTYQDFPSIRSAFLGGDITEEHLKKGLIASLNQLLQPVRTHFTTNDRARSLLEQVRQFKKDAKTSTTTSSSSSAQLRRLDLVKAGMISPGSHVVFAPLPTTKPSVNDAIRVLDQIRLASSTSSSIPVVLFFSDWSARVCGSCDADVKVIDSYKIIFVTALRALDPALMEHVTILNQSDAILVDPSNYWISVINVGRHFMLDDVMGRDVVDADGVGKVIARLMRLADIIGLAPASIAFLVRHDDDDDAASSSKDAAVISDQVEMGLIGRFFDEKLDSGTASLTKPRFFIAERFSSLSLQPPRELEAHKTDNDEYFILDDPKVHGKSKMKRAFCEPGNISFCPPIVFTSVFGLGPLPLANNKSPQIIIHRSEDNGGDITYKNRIEMEKDFESGSLHPGDLKATASTMAVDMLNKISESIKGDANAVKASKTIKAFEKKMAKKKKSV